MDSWVDFENQTVFILGGGPSLSLININELRGRSVIAVNDAIYLAPFADILFFRDLRWFHKNREIIEKGDQISVTTNETAGKFAHVNYVKMVHAKRFCRLDDEYITYGRSSGHIAVSLAIALAARRVVLLGFDCRIVDGKTHFHDRFEKQSPFLYEKDFLPSWSGWNQRALNVGTEVINSTVDSAIQEFPFMPFTDVLKDES